MTSIRPIFLANLHLVLTTALLLENHPALGQGLQSPSFNTLSINSSILSGPSSVDHYANPITINYGALDNATRNNYGFGPSCNVASVAYSGQLFCGYSKIVVNNIGNPIFPGDQFVGHFAFASGAANTTAKSASIFGGNDNVNVTGTGWSYLVGREIDVTATQPVLNKNGLRIVQAGNDKHQGSTADAAINLINQPGAIGWKNIILLDATSGNIPVLAGNGCIVCTAGAAKTTTGIDVSGWAFSGSAFRSPGFNVDGQGNTVAKSVKLSKTSAASLPACNSDGEGALFAVIDSKSSTFSAPIVPGGSHHVMAYCNGTRWTVR